jgi:hypothetical protein
MRRGLGLLLGVLVGCGSAGSTTTQTGGAGGGGAGVGGVSGGGNHTGAAGNAGNGGTGAVAGMGGTGAVAGMGGTGAVAGMGGTGAVAGMGGTGAVAGMGGTGAVAGMGGTGAVAGMGGTGAVAGMGGTGAVAGMGGTGAVAGMGGTGAVAGMGGLGGGGGSGGCSADPECDDGLFCNGAEACVLGVCVAGSSPCDDGVNCTTDACDEGTDACLSVPEPSLCPDDGVACNGTEVCDAVLGCTSVNAPDCDDGIACTQDLCDAQTGACAHVPNDNDCSDGTFCNGLETCDEQLGCQPGLPPVCNDGVACTVDVCDPLSDACAYVPSAALCDDGLFCNGAETCSAQLGCQPGVAPDCDDGVSCTADACDDGSASCTHTPVHAACDDGLPCNGVETCSASAPPGSGCVGGMPVPCGPDGVSCTVDACNDATGLCEHVPNNAACAPGEFCVIAQGGCTTGQPCGGDAECQDDTLCNGAEQCVLGICQPGTPVQCDDNVDCTIDVCQPATGACVHNPTDFFCSDGLACTGIETCDAQLGCVSTPPPDCDDGVACTDDFCSEPSGLCANVPVQSFCDDGNLCNGLEICNAQQGCLPPAQPYTCPDDGIACTTQVCNPQINACVTIPDSSLCGCGETCDPQQGCGNFCQVATCQGKVYACGDCLDNDGDCKIDSADDHCLGPCDNTEDSFYGGIAGQNNSPCKQDCYFDQDTGAGNDDCFWSHKCDPLEVPPDYPPEGSQCEYNPNANIPGYNGTCGHGLHGRSRPNVPELLRPAHAERLRLLRLLRILPGVPYTVWLGSENPSGTGSCNLEYDRRSVDMCKPCTQVQVACLNTCDDVRALRRASRTLPPELPRADLPRGACRSAGCQARPPARPARRASPAAARATPADARRSARRARGARSREGSGASARSGLPSRSRGPPRPPPAHARASGCSGCSGARPMDLARRRVTPCRSRATPPRRSPEAWPPRCDPHAPLRGRTPRRAHAARRPPPHEGACGEPRGPSACSCRCSRRSPCSRSRRRRAPSPAKSSP